jgi:hypothetical protein
LISVWLPSRCTDELVLNDDALCDVLAVLLSMLLPKLLRLQPPFDLRPITEQPPGDLATGLLRIEPRCSSLAGL